jgi:hypothetical protein
MGLLVDTSAASEKEQQLIRTYQFFQVPMQGTAPVHNLRGYTLDDTRSALLEPRKGKEAVVITFDTPPDDLPGTDNDSLIWFECNPDCDDMEFGPDGQRKTKAAC